MNKILIVSSMKRCSGHIGKSSIRSKSNEPKKTNQKKNLDIPENNSNKDYALNVNRKSWGGTTGNNNISTSLSNKDLQTPLLFDQISITNNRGFNNKKEYYTVEKEKGKDTIDKGNEPSSHSFSKIVETQIDKIYCLKIDDRKYLLFSILCLFTCFIIALLSELFPTLKVKLKFKKCAIKASTHFLILTKDGKLYIIESYKISLPQLHNCNILNYTKIPVDSNETKMFEFKLHKFAFSPLLQNFVRIKFNLNSNATYDIIRRKMNSGLTPQEVEFQKMIYCFKSKNLQEIKSLLRLLYIEIKNPFYLIQFICIIFWLKFQYSNYAVILLTMTTVTLFLAIFEIKQNLSLIHKISRYSCMVNIYRINKDGSREIINVKSDELVPGDIFEIPEGGNLMPCDALLISGNVILNESFLTGESNPIFKTHIPSSFDKFNSNKDSIYILYSGTRILQVKNRAFGLVIGIGTDTEKGNLIRAILYKDNNSKNKNNVDYEIFKIIIFILIIAVVGIFFFAIPSLIDYGYGFQFILFKIFDLITTIMPSALPGCLVINISLCLFHIKRKGINCLDRRKISIIGNIDVICFDKTGTLTEDDLDLYGYRLITYNNRNFIFQKFREDINEIISSSYTYYKKEKKENIHEDKVQKLNMFYIECLACCNSLTKVGNNLIGDPIDLAMFNSSQWSFDESKEDKPMFLAWFRPKEETDITNLKLNNNDDGLKILKSRYEIGLIRRFDFVSKLQRMSVIVKNMNEDFFKIYCKGSPEKIRELCKAETIPSNYNKILTKYTNHGLRVLALCCKMIKMDFVQSMKIARESVEHEMIFLGFFIVGNKLRNKTKPTIDVIKNANIKTIISTGDNLFTAISVGKECHIVSEDEEIYQCDLIPFKSPNGDLVYKLSMKEIIVDIDDESDSDTEEEEESSSSDSITMRTSRTKRKMSKLTNNMIVDSISEDDMESESDGYEENDIQLKFANLKNNNLNKSPHSSTISLLQFDENINIKSNSVFAITGKTFDILYNLTLNSSSEIYKEIFSLILKHTVIYGRMFPEHKALVIECLKTLNNNTVAMVGDGANDIWALKTANVGISLGLDDTAISAHFISKSPEIKCIIRLICEGKSCLVTTIECYKYMILIYLVQFITSLFLLKFNTFLSTNQCLICDLFIVFPNAILISQTGAVKYLTEERPNKLRLKIIMLTILPQFTLMILFQYISYRLLKSRAWYIQYVNNKYDDKDLYNDTIEQSYENTLFFLLGYLQYLICIVTVSSAKPFKKGILHNKMLVCYLVAMMLFGYYLILVPDNGLDGYFQLKIINDQGFRFMIILVAVANFLSSIYLEKEILPILYDKFGIITE